MSGDGPVLPLPDLPASQHGTSTAQATHYKAEVSNAAGYMCHIHVECEFAVPPDVMFEIFTHPDNSVAFRDIKRVGYRKVLQSHPGFKLVEVEQVGAMKILWIERTFSTLLRVEEDCRQPDCLRTTFDLVRSDVLAKFHGSWQLRPVADPETGRVVGCKGELHQDVLPRGVPPFLAHLPVLGGLLRSASLGTIRRLMEDMGNLVDRVKSSGKSVGEVIDDVAAERGHEQLHKGQTDWGGNEAVKSFQISETSLSDDDEDGGAPPAQQQVEAGAGTGAGQGDSQRQQDAGAKGGGAPQVSVEAPA